MSTLKPISELKLPKFINKKFSDPVNASLYVHHMDSKNRFSVNILDYYENKKHSQNTSTIKRRNKSEFSWGRFETISSDYECVDKFNKINQKTTIKPQVGITTRQTYHNNIQKRQRTKQISGKKTLLKQLSKKKELIEIDLLKLDTNYAKLINQSNNALHKSVTSEPNIFFSFKSERKKIEKQIPSIPKQEFLATFIKQYKATDQNINVSDLVRSQNFAVRLTEEILYFGQILNQQYEGKGIMITLQNIFQGEWHQSEKYSGTQISKCGIFKGRFKKGLRHGVGEFRWYNGQHYSGQWCKNKKHGTGVWRSPNQDLYMGQWINGKVHGYGVHLTNIGQKYEGYFQNFLKEGEGKQYFVNGDSFQGTFHAGKPHGRGIYRWRIGAIYEGDFTDGLREGKGKIYNHELQYIGNFLRERADGEGKVRLVKGVFHQGTFKNGQKHGKGIQKGKNIVRVGTWQNNSFRQKIIS